MKWAFLFLSCLPAVNAASLGEVKSLYLLPMSHGLDQYLASRFTSSQVLPVVADPKAADAVVTDRLGPAFEARLEELYPRPEPPAKSTEAAAKDEKDKDKKDDEEKEAAPKEIVTGAAVGGMSGFGRGKGNIFIVDVATRQILWSTHEPPESSAPADLNRSAERIAREVKKALTGKTK
jgi:hypothetical protein